MAFELVIAMKRDPAEAMERAQSRNATTGVPASPVATLDVRGDFSEQHAEELERSVERVLAGPADSVLIRFATADCERPAVLSFSRWLDEMRRAGSDVRIIEGESHVHELLTENDTLPEAAMPLADAEAAARRRIIDAHH